MISKTQIAVDGVRSLVMQVGPPDASEAVVFVHGNPGPSDDWRDLLGRVGEFARAVAPDMPGYGCADKPTAFDYTVDGYARHLGGLLDQLGVRRAHLVTHDFGGPWAMTWAAQHPNSFASAILINTGVTKGYKWHIFAKIWRTPVLGEVFMRTATRSSVRLLLAHSNPRLTRNQIDHIYDATKSWGTKRAVLRLYRATPESVLGAHDDELRALDRPALVVWGTKDPYIPVERAKSQRDAFPTARIELLEGGGHWVFLEDPEAVASLVVPFIREQLGADGRS